MKKTIILLMFSSLIIFSGCKKNMPAADELEATAVKKPVSKMNVPGQSNTESYLVPQTDGTYKAAWQGDMTFGNMPHPITNVVNGKPIDDIQIINVGNEYLEVITAGPYFIVVRPTFVGDTYPVIRSLLGQFYVAYQNYRSRKKDMYGNPVQPQFPNIDTYINTGNGNGEIIVKGMVVSSTSSPSKMSIVSANFVPPSDQPALFLLNNYIVGTVNYDLAGDANGEIVECTAYDTATNLPVAVYGFNGTYTNDPVTNIATVNIKIWTTPTTFITYIGTL